MILKHSLVYSSKRFRKVEAKGLPANEYLKYFKERIKYWEGKAPDEKALGEWAKKELVLK